MKPLVSAMVCVAISLAAGYSLLSSLYVASAASSAVVAQEANGTPYEDGYHKGYADGLDWGRSHCGAAEETDPVSGRSGPYWDSYKQGYLAGFPEGLSNGQAGHCVGTSERGAPRTHDIAVAPTGLINESNFDDRSPSPSGDDAMFLQRIRDAGITKAMISDDQAVSTAQRIIYLVCDRNGPSRLDTEELLVGKFGMSAQQKIAFTQAALQIYRHTSDTNNCGSAVR
ncbi:DUF732 domain-containing protein [Actinoallomurus sp. NBC_01490]|uniref:DUF732 domain-containing protein n=1 Tax=Actinoallomurus sp. NBC_01490 TaxID=2903557 RepID=UPI002E335C16|nr:DUF732 domain-containing protein [Actinoallomurus sp. NBC_01490]